MSDPSASVASDPRAVRVRKRSLLRRVQIAERSGVCETLEGKVPYRGGDAIVTGEQGERWPIACRAFEVSYEPVAPTLPGASGIYRSRPIDVWAVQLQSARTVPAGDGGQLKGNAGDWLIQYQDGSN